MSDFGLAEYIAELRRELEESMEGAQDEHLKFDLGPVELTVSVTVVKSAGPTAHLRLAVVDIGADASTSRENLQTLKLTLTPSWTVQVDDEAFENER